MTTIASKAPLRLGLAGGGTDVSPYADLYSGCVVNATISLFAHCIVETNCQNVTFLSAENSETLGYSVTQAELEGTKLQLHRATYLRIINEFAGGRQCPMKILTYSDVPTGSGMGASSALVVAMIAAISESLNIRIEKSRIAELAVQIEREDCKIQGGRQDQYSATYGGLNVMEFHSNNRVDVFPIEMRRRTLQHLESRILLYFTGQSRESSEIIKRQSEATVHGDLGAILAGHELKQAAINMRNALQSEDAEETLQIIINSWKSKKRLAEGISNDHIETIAAAAKDNGAEGLKISGAGGGGFALIVAPPIERFRVINALTSLNGRFYPFQFTQSGVAVTRYNRN